MKTRIFQQLDPRDNRLPADTSRFVQPKPHRTLPLVNPDRFVQNIPAIQANLAQFDPTNPREIRANSRENIQRLAEQANRHLAESIHFKSIRFSVDEQAGRTVAVIRDQQSGRVLRQIPSDKMLMMAARLRTASGLLTDIEV